MTDDLLLALGDASALRGYDSRSVERGRRYSADGRVRLVDVAPGAARAHVVGTGSSPYTVDLEWWIGARGLVVTDECSCPLGGSCKHAVATILEIAFLSESGYFQPASRGRTGRPKAAPPAGLRHLRSVGPAPAAPTPRWKSALADLAVPTVPDALPLALQFSVDIARATAFNPHPRMQLSVRPLRMGDRRRWIKSGASWRDVASGYAYDLKSSDPGQLAALRAIAAIDTSLAYGSSSGPLLVEQFGAAFWVALRNAASAGVALIDEGGDLNIVVSDSALSIGLDLRATVDGDVVADTQLLLDGEPLLLDPQNSAVIGSPPVGAFHHDGTLLTLFALDRPVDRTVAALLRSDPLIIPGADFDEFLDDYQPQLARHVSVRSGDGSVSVEPARLSEIVARVTHDDVGTAELQWVARYLRGDRSTDHLLERPGGSGRDRVAEKDLFESIAFDREQLAELVGPTGMPMSFTATGHDAVVLLTQVVPSLESLDGIAVELLGGAPPLRQAAEAPLVSLNVTDADDPGNDWFDLAVQVSIDGEEIEFSRLFTALAVGAQSLILPSGTWMSLDRPELAQLRTLIEEASALADDDGADGRVRINPFQSDWWAELAELGVVESQTQRWADNVERMAALDAPQPVQVPAGLAAELRPYQREGLDWLAFLHQNHLGGVLADDMGLGKTLQSIALFLRVLDAQPDARFLVIAPTSVVANWRREVERFARGVSVCTITETQSRRGVPLGEAIGDASIVVTSYALSRLEVEQYEAIDWEVLVLDEAQFVKNHRSKSYQCVRRIPAVTKLAITGTPIENSLMDLWSLLSITAPGLYPDPKRFSEVYRKPIESGNSPERLATLRRRVAPLIRRRTKGEVLSELPPKVEQVVDIELGPAHSKLYKSQLQLQRKKVLGLMEDVTKNRFEIFKSLTLLRQLSLDPGLVDAEHDGVGSAKLDRLVEDLDQLVSEGHRALVFSTFTKFLGRARDRLDEAGIGYAYLDGRTRDRDAAIERFTSGDAPVFLISLKAGGFGLNLTEADYCFVLDPWWNPAAETQAIDRAHRIGQTNTVMVYRYVSVDTIEDKVMELKARKAALFDMVLDADDGALAGTLEADDIRALLE